MKKKEHKTSKKYSKFKHIDGSHPLKDLLPDSHICYQARTRKNGKVSFFNFDFAKEIGLIPLDHSNEINKELEEQILESFSLIIINEYDEQENKQFKEEEKKTGTYMATRYLQPQHKDNIGLNSGDGRSIWNGVLKGRGKLWDLSSRGTGATKLSPATTKFGKYFESGDPSISYGCGYAELDEVFESTFFSEVLHCNGLKTERTLAIITFEKGFSIAVRAYENLLRPSHLFRYLKQNNLASLKAMTLYYINRQEINGSWRNIPSNEAERLKFFLEKQIEVFAETAARFEDDYIFCWIDWDGDNILMDGAIIDYGSVRQFGMYHHGYRFDDDGTFSITIEQQKTKARYIAQTFVQLVDALLKGKKKNLDSYSKHKLLKKFDEHFENCKNKNLVRKIGFDENLIETLSKDSSLKKLRSAFAFFERIQSKSGKYKVSDGISHDAIFCMRDILREYPQLLLRHYENISEENFLEIIRSSYAQEKDLDLNPKRKEQISLFQQHYQALIENAAKLEKISEREILLHITMRSSVINKYDRITGDSITLIVNKIIKAKPKLTSDEIYHILKRFYCLPRFKS